MLEIQKATSMLTIISEVPSGKASTITDKKRDREETEDGV